ncbi:MAG TPA: hypothetical protein VHC91_21915 [Trinickia sp.]|uniref:hypothetical protein n=1 Tax=Trinickia sp. TaxID=2571163 RepID=UPI002C6A13EE|nr:hypothetical protein [Trinickia sp.]HVW53021.1 hypothetical protein [Trinickia sp.]
MCCPASWAALGAAVIGATASAYSADQQRKSAHEAQDAQKATGTAQTATAADTSGVNTTSGPAAAGVNSGQASTLLTGPGGIDPSKLKLGAGASMLGSNSLLGQ